MANQAWGVVGVTRHGAKPIGNRGCQATGQIVLEGQPITLFDPDQTFYTMGD